MLQSAEVPCHSCVSAAFRAPHHALRHADGARFTAGSKLRNLRPACKIVERHKFLTKHTCTQYGRDQVNEAEYFLFGPFHTCGTDQIGPRSHANQHLLASAARASDPEALLVLVWMPFSIYGVISTAWKVLCYARRPLAL